jgi:primase-polymerase (primpol)-like protein
LSGPTASGSGARASSTDPTTCSAFETALEAVGGFDRLGFVLGDGWIGIDFDAVLDEASEIRRNFRPLEDVALWIAAFST